MIGGLINSSYGGYVLAEEAEETAPKLPEIFIKAINPGYTIDGASNVGEIIEIGRLGSDTPISLAGLTVGYTNSSGNEAILAEFPENSFLVGESILLRLASSPESELAAMTYSKTLAFKAGPLVLKRGEKIIDSICWTGANECETPFKSASPTILVRNLETGKFEHKSKYESHYVAENYYLEENENAQDEEADDRVKSQCKGMVFSEVYSFYEELKTEQFVELYNTSAEQILLDGCKIRYKNKDYPLNGIMKADTYYARFLTDFNISKNPTNYNTLELIDINGKTIDRIDYPNGQKKGTSYALIGYDKLGEEIWRTTYVLTPGEPNNYQEFRTCEAGKVVNEATGNCVKMAVVTEKVCPTGQYLNPLSGRCKKIEIAVEKTCKEGYELNEETGRCRKVKENDGANYSLVTEKYEEKTSFVALYAVVGVIIIGVIYIIYEFRSEIRKLFRRVFRRFH